MYELAIYNLAFRLKAKGVSVSQIIELLDIKRSTIYLWFKDGQKSVYQYQRSKTIKRNIKDYTLEIITQHPTYSLKSLTVLLNEKLDKPVSLWTMYRTIKSLNLTYKKVYKIGTHKGINDLIPMRTKFSDYFKCIPIDKLLCIDETSVYERANACKAWSPKRIRFHLPMDRAICKRKTLIASLGIDKPELMTCLNETCNGERFANYLSNLLQSVKGKYTHILMDNAAIHKTKQVKNILDSYNITPIYIAPYSPEWNPVEMFFSYLKRTHDYIHNKHTCFEKKLDNINSKIGNLCTKWFKHVQNDILLNFHR